MSGQTTEPTAKYYVLTLAPDEHTELTAAVQQRRIASKRLVRAQCLLAVAANGPGWTDEQTSQGYQVSTRSLERLRKRAGEAGVEAALTGQPRQQWPASKYAKPRPTWRPRPAPNLPPATPTGRCNCWPSAWWLCRYCHTPARRWWDGC